MNYTQSTLSDLEKLAFIGAGIGAVGGGYIAGEDNTTAGAVAGGVTGKVLATAGAPWSMSPYLKHGLTPDQTAALKDSLKGQSLLNKTKLYMDAANLTGENLASGSVKWQKGLRAFGGQMGRVGMLGAGGAVIGGLGAKYLGWGQEPTTKTSAIYTESTLEDYILAMSTDC
jgi:hypothetical protein